MAPAARPPFRVEAVLPANASSYFLERDSAAFRSLLAKTLKIGQLECAGVWREGASTFVKIITKPEFGSWVPKGVASQLQSANLEFHDVIEFNPAHIASPPYTTFIRTESPFLGDKLDVRMTMRVEAVEEGGGGGGGGARCRQVLEGHIRVRMFGVGRIVEGIVKESLHNTYKKLPEIVRRWQLFREEALRAGDGRQLLLGRPPVGCEVTWIRREVLAVLKEPLPAGADGALSPNSALCPAAGASEASGEDSPSAALARSQRRIQQHLAAAAASAGAEQPGAEEAASEAAHIQRAGTGLPGDAAAAAPPPRRTSTSLYAGASVYYDASEALPEGEDASSGDGPAAPALPGPRPRPQPQPQRWQDAPWMPESPAPAAAAADEATPSPQPAGEPASPLSAAALAAAVLSRSARHRRTVSTESATSTDTPLGEDGQPASSRQPLSRRYWRRWNRDVAEWGAYWGEVGVREDEEDADDDDGDGGGGGVVGRALRALEGLLRDSYYSTSILVALYLMRHGWLRVEPDTDAAGRHDEAARSHVHHRHSLSSSWSGLPLGERWPSSGGGSEEGGPTPPAAGRPPPPLSSSGGSMDVAAAVQPQSLARVAQEVCGRMVSSGRAVAAAPVRAVVAAGSGVRQAGVTGARALSSRMRPRSAGGSGDEASARGAPPGAPAASAAAAEVPTQQPPPPAHEGGVARLLHLRHRKTLSLDAGTAAAAQEAAAVARKHPPRAGAPGLSPVKELQRRPSNVAAETAMASARRAESRVHAPSRLACFSVCGRAPAVQD